MTFSLTYSATTKSLAQVHKHHRTSKAHHPHRWWALLMRQGGEHGNRAQQEQRTTLPQSHRQNKSQLPHLRQTNRLHTPTPRPRRIRSRPHQTPQTRRHRHTQQHSRSTPRMQLQKTSPSLRTNHPTLRLTPINTTGGTPYSPAPKPSGVRKNLSPTFFPPTLFQNRGVSLWLIDLL